MVYVLQFVCVFSLFIFLFPFFEVSLLTKIFTVFISHIHFQRLYCVRSPFFSSASNSTHCELASSFIK